MLVRGCIVRSLLTGLIAQIFDALAITLDIGRRLNELILRLAHARKVLSHTDTANHQIYSPVRAICSGVRDPTWKNGPVTWPRRIYRTAHMSSCGPLYYTCTTTARQSLATSIVAASSTRSLRTFSQGTVQVSRNTVRCLMSYIFVN